MVLLGSRGLLKLIRSNLRISDFCGALPFKWNESQNRLQMKSKGKVLVYSTRLYMSIIYFFLVLIQVIRVVKSTSLMVITHTIMFLSAASLCFSLQIVNNFELPRIVGLFNCFIHYEESRPHDFPKEGPKMTATEIFVRLLIQTLTYTGIVTPIIYHMDIFRNPCFPVNLGYWLSNHCTDQKLGYQLKPVIWNFMEITKRMSICIISYNTWSLLMCGGCFLVSMELILQGHSLRTSVTTYGRKLMETKRVDAETRKTMESYRQLQLICIQYRMIYSRYMIGCSIPCVIVVQSICLYNTISLLAGEDTGGSLGYNLLYAWCGTDCLFIIMIVFGIFADIYSKSSKVQERLKGHVQLKKNKWFRRWIQSCPVLRVYFGASNYIDQLTPLTLEDFVIDQTASLILLKR